MTDFHNLTVKNSKGRLKRPEPVQVTLKYTNTQYIYIGSDDMVQQDDDGLWIRKGNDVDAELYFYPWDKVHRIRYKYNVEDERE